MRLFVFTAIVVFLFSAGTTAYVNSRSDRASDATASESPAHRPEIDLATYLRRGGTVLHAPSDTTDEHLKQLLKPEFRNLQELVLTDTAITNTGVKRVSHLSLEKLYLTGTNTSDEALKSLSKMSTLRRLSLKGTKMKGEGLSNLVHLPIQKIYLNSTEVDDSCAKYLKQLPLNTLYLENTTFGDVGMNELRELSIAAINISNTLVSDSSMPILQQFPLQKAYIKGSKLSAASVEALRNAKVAIDM